MLDNIGAIVATELHGMSGWTGPATRWWAIFDRENPKEIPIAHLRKHLVHAIPQADNDRPDGYIWIIAFDVHSSGKLCDEITSEDDDD